ncbi:MAG TPA: hypothetical protein GX747_04850 [Tenericutes bacterium]|nr:hypothetical protein [Mycoplasmatota bacterium]
MKHKKELKQLKKEEKSLVDYKWIITVSLMAFFISLFFSFTSELILPNTNFIIGILVLIIFILLGIIFDILGVAVTSSDEKPFHSMSSRRVKGSNISVKLIKNAEKVSSFCNDVIGDICGIVSGSAGAIIAITLSQKFNFNQFTTSLIVTSIIASLTIGGKAIGKSFAIDQSNIIVYKFSKLVSIFYKVKRNK